MAKVYLSKKIEKILEKIDYSRLGEKVAIKLHFGEKGCVTYTNPELAKKVYDKIKSLGKEAVLVECNVLYRGSRTNTSDHLQTAREHNFEGDVEILDGEKGEEFLEAELDKGEVKKVKLGKGLENYDSMIVLSHFKGHIMAGFGGAIKNLGMGLASRAGKLQMHSDVSPAVGSKCTACGTCIENCNTNAISLVDGKAKINNEKCEGCAMCIAVCPQEAINIPWGSSTYEQLQKKVVDYTQGVFKIIPEEKMIFINVLENITKDCDCFNKIQKPITEDIGILAGEDIVAIDKASLDLVNKKTENKFEKLNPSGITQLDYAEEKGLGSQEYEIEELDE